VQFVFERNRIALRPCSANVERGKALGAASDFEAAASAFREASEHDPYDPEPWYQLGFTYVFLGRHREAVDAYDRVEELAPGWFHCREERFVAQLLAAETIDADTHALLTMLQDGAEPPDEKLAMADAALVEHGELALLHLHRAVALDNLGRRDEALLAFRRGLEAKLREPATETRLLFGLAAAADGAERDEAIERAITLDGNRVSAAMARMLLRAIAH
jgi:Flp pilus assembly protein TadD